jgi:hypothetical protein
MVHDITPLDNWHHEIGNELCIAANYVRSALRDLQEGNTTECLIALQKSLPHHEKISFLLKENYIERKRNGE